MEIRFLGPLGIVTGSCTWMRDIDHDWSFLVDCGIQQGEATAENWNEAHWPFDPKEIKFVVLTHAHMDHCGLIPALYRQGFSGPVYCTKETAELAKLLLRDAVRHSEMPYSEADIERVQWREPGRDKAFGEFLPVDNNLFLQFFRTGHIVGGVSVAVSWGPKGENQRSIHFSGDLGPGSEDQESLALLRFRMAPSKTHDYAVVESTYGGTVRDPAKQTSQSRRHALRNLLDDTLASGGALILPAFSLARTQDLMFDLHWVVAEAAGRFDRLDFRLDSPLATKMNPIVVEALSRTERNYKGRVRPRWLGKQFFRELGLDDKDSDDIQTGQAILDMAFETKGAAKRKHMQRGNEVARNWRPIFASTEDARSFRRSEVEKPTVLVTSSGTCDGGPVVTWLSKLLTSNTTTVAMTGHCASNTIGGQLLAISHVPVTERQRDSGYIQLRENASIKVANIRASIRKIEGYSAHGDQQDLLNWLVWERHGTRNLNGREVFVQHGEDRQRKALSEALAKRASKHQLAVTSHMPDDPEKWWSLEGQHKAEVIDLAAERLRVEKEIRALQGQLKNLA